MFKGESIRAYSANYGTKLGSNPQVENKQGNFTELENLQGCLDAIKDVTGGCDIRISGTITSNDLKIYIAQTSRVVDHYSLTNDGSGVCQNFLANCKQLATRLPMQGFGFEIVTEQSKRLLEQGVPSFCHAFLCVVSDNPQGALVMVLDRPLVVPENARSKAITILNMLPEGERSPPRVELDHLDPVGGSCEALVEEVRELGTYFWVCQYLGDFARFQSAGIPIIHAHEIKVLVSSGNTEPDYLRALVWFALGVESTRNRVNLPFGTFLILRSGQNETLFAIAKLD